MQTLIIAFLIATSTFGAVGCATIAASLPAIMAAIQDSALIVSQIESFVNLYFKLNPSPDKEKKIGEAIARVKTALEAAQRLANGVDKLDQGQIDGAFVEIRNAYTDLVALCGSFGIGVEMGDKTTRVKAAPGGKLIVPTPMVFAGKV